VEKEGSGSAGTADPTNGRTGEGIGVTYSCGVIGRDSNEDVSGTDVPVSFPISMHPGVNERIMRTMTSETPIRLENNGIRIFV
jgi:hypothetical protein